MLEAREVIVRFGRHIVAVDGVSLGVSPGEVVTLCGPNGAGKSTLLAALAGDRWKGDGAVLMDDRPIGDYSSAELATRRAVLEQTPSLSAAFTVGQLAGLSIPVQVPPDRTDEIIRDSLDDVGLSARAGHRADVLSGGQRHRAHLARVLGQLAGAEYVAQADGVASNGGRYLLLDEPTASLDLVHQIAVMKVARRAASRGVGVLVVLHDLNLAAAFSDRIALLCHGRLVSQGSAAEVMTADRLSTVYETEIDVDLGPQNNLRITPVLAPSAAA